MTADEIKALVERLRAAAEKATQGQWSHTRMGVVAGGPIQHFTNGSGQNQIVMMTGAEWMKDGEKEANADHIAASNPENVLAILSQVETLTLENQRLRVDAERYRMIRNRSDYWRQHGRQAVMLGMFEEFLDAAIDAARAQIDKEKP